MKVIGLAGSPRRGGNTDLLLLELLRGASETGAETKMVPLSGLEIKPCQHCDECLKDGHCVINDDMQLLYRELAQADRIVIASPVQFMGPTAEVKAMIDRCQALWARKYVLKIPPLSPEKERRGFFISVGGRRVKDLFLPSLEIVKTFFRVINVTYSGDLLLSGVDEKGVISQNLEALRKAYMAGKNLSE